MDTKRTFTEIVEHEFSVADLLFMAKRKLEGTKIKKEQHCLGYIDEAIKWTRNGID